MIISNRILKNQDIDWELGGGVCIDLWVVWVEIKRLEVVEVVCLCSTVAVAFVWKGLNGWMDWIWLFKRAATGIVVVCDYCCVCCCGYR